MKHQYRTLRLILGDQLNAKHSWFQTKEDDTLYVLAELHQEAEYVPHHIQKVCAFFCAMEQFASGLNQAGYHVLHLNLDDTQAYKTLPDLITSLLSQYKIQKFEYQLADEYRLREQMDQAVSQFSVECQAYETEHFYLNQAACDKDFTKGKRHRMEAFYRKMRKRFNILLHGDDPVGGQWNYDSENRNKLKPADFLHVPKPLVFSNDVSAILARIRRHNIKTIGVQTPDLLWPVNRQQALQLLDFFCEQCLPYFGQFQDAMTAQLDASESLGDNGKLVNEQAKRQWSLYHSRLSFALNAKMISPMKVVSQAIAHYEKNKQHISLAQIEGFVRQILGWREFVRGIYWANMPEYGQLNALCASRDLPSWFWTGKTHMNCLKQAINQSLEFAYAHHIQRLMITGNFSLLAGIDPNQVDEWYLGIYIDAIEWVEMPNTRGMSQFADGGIVGSKAYAASGNYVKKMSDYCSDCRYKVTQVTGHSACPLNAMYWHFMHTHHDDFAANPRNKMVFANWLKKSPDQREAILQHAKESLKNIEHL